MHIYFHRWFEKYGGYGAYLDPYYMLTVCFSANLAIGIFFIMHIFLIYINGTSVEWGELLVMGRPYSVSPKIDNFKQIFGDKIYLWFWPWYTNNSRSKNYLSGLNYPDIYERDENGKIKR